MEIRTDIEIEASPERVWQLLTDFESYPQWNPFIRSIRGEAAIGSRLRVHLKPSGGRGMTVRPVVLRSDPPREFRWLGRVLLPHLFDGEHVFEIQHVGATRIRFVQREIFTGLLMPLLWKMIETDTRRGFQEMNQALKVRCERQ